MKGVFRLKKADALLGSVRLRWERVGVFLHASNGIIVRLNDVTSKLFEQWV